MQMHFKFSNIPKAKSSKKDGNKAESLSNNDSIQTTSKILEYLPKGSAIVFNDVVDDFQSADSKADSNDKQIFVTNCRNSVILSLGSNTSVTIENCVGCVIICGPCRGSVFVRECENCSLFVICHQFRVSKCRPLVVQLFCATSPTVEDSDIKISPLCITYPGLNELFENGELSKSTNFWDRVANFTPDSSSVVITSPRRIESLADLSENLPAGTFERFKTLVIDKGLITLNNAYCV